MKKLTKALIPAALFAVSFATHAETSDGKVLAVSAGWAHIMPQGTKQGVYNTPPFFPAPDAGFELKDSDTAEFKFDYLVNDNVSLGLILGVPPTFDIKGKGQLLGGALPIDKFSKVGDVKVYSPVITGKYTFGTVESKFRPYVGAGFMYAHFSNFKLDSSISSYLTSPTFITITHNTLKDGASIRNVKIDDAVAPVAFVGADYNITKNWFATASVSYVHLSTHAKLDVVNNTTGATLLTGRSKIEINPIVTYLGVGYRF